ncbi:MAG TPA: RNA polymerase sigma factor [Pyrinomonadaceae bacterium]
MASYDLLPTRTFFLGVTAESPQDADYALAREVAGGRTAAVGDLYDRHRRRVYSLCLRMTGNAADAEDLTQEIFIHLLRKIGSFRGESQFTTWLHRLAVNQVLMYFRRVKARKEQMAENVDAEISVSQRRKHAARSQVVERIALDAALAQVAPARRQVFVLHDVEGYSHGEIASMLGLKIGTSKSQLHKARRKLRRLLNSDGPAEP